MQRQSTTVRRGRGRPRHDDILTPREWEVVRLLEAGLTNEQIAERLQISHSGAKYHVSEILSKLGAATREEAVVRLRALEHERTRTPWFAGIVAFFRPHSPAATKPAIAVPVIALLLLLGTSAVLVLTDLPGAITGSDSPGQHLPSDDELAQAMADFTGTPGDAAGISFTDPWAYCQAIGTIDEPDSRYIGKLNPPKMVIAFARVFGVPPTSTMWSGTVSPALFWRCAEGRLLVCTIGANIPCELKADTSTEPTRGVIDWCANPPPNAQGPGGRIGVPAFVTGRHTAYLGAWECIDGKPVITGQPAEVDGQGFIARFWYQVVP